MDETLEWPGASVEVGELCRTVPPSRQTGAPRQQTLRALIALQ